MIGERLSEIRKDHDETQAALAKRLGVSLPTIRAWEQERSSPSHEMLATICRIYNVSADYLLGLSDVDSADVRRKRLEQFSAEERAELKEYESFLLWKQRQSK